MGQYGCSTTITLVSVATNSDSEVSTAFIVRATVAVGGDERLAQFELPRDNIHYNNDQRATHFHLTPPLLPRTIGGWLLRLRLRSATFARSGYRRDAWIIQSIWFLQDPECPFLGAPVAPRPSLSWLGPASGITPYVPDQSRCTVPRLEIWVLFDIRVPLPFYYCFSI